MVNGIAITCYILLLLCGADEGKLSLMMRETCTARFLVTQYIVKFIFFALFNEDNAVGMKDPSEEVKRVSIIYMVNDALR